MAHEYGHHIQNLLGINSRVRPNDKRASVRLELQADYLADMWTHEADRQFHILEGGDLESAIQSANSIGDNTLQKRSGSGFVHPEQYTHGTSAQRRSRHSPPGTARAMPASSSFDRFFSTSMTVLAGNWTRSASFGEIPKRTGRERESFPRPVPVTLHGVGQLTWIS